MEMPSPSRRGKHKRTKATREKMRKASLGNQVWKGRKHSKETKEKMKAAKLGKKNPMFGVTGINHPKYIKDRTQVKLDPQKMFDTEYKTWMLKVKRRDKWTCVINNEDCSGRLEAHHILPWSEFPELRYNINNGVSLCQHHHPRKPKDVAKLAPVLKKIVAKQKLKISGDAIPL